MASIRCPKGGKRAVAGSAPLNPPLSYVTLFARGLCPYSRVLSRLMTF